MRKRTSKPERAPAVTVQRACSASEPSYQDQLDAWKAKHGVTHTDESNPHEMRMLAEQKTSTEKSWCLGCDAHMPVKEMVLITRRIDPYKQMDEGETDYISKANRVYYCSPCYKAEYED